MFGLHPATTRNADPDVPTIPPITAMGYRVNVGESRLFGGSQPRLRSLPDAQRGGDVVGWEGGEEIAAEDLARGRTRACKPCCPDGRVDAGVRADYAGHLCPA